MKKKDKLSEPITKNDLKKELQSLEKRLSKVIEITQKLFRIEIITNTMSIKQEFVKALADFRNEMFTKIDPLLSEIVDSREDREITTEYLRKLQQKSDNHEKRIVKLEQKPA